MHSKFSDGGSTVDELVDRAVANGCDVLAITDHTDGDLKAATPEYHAAIASARARVPKLVLITGIEWNVPPGKGQDHAVVLFPPEMDNAVMTGEFKNRFDDQLKEGENPELAVAAFEWLRQKSSGASAMPVVFLDHPSRKAKDLASVRAEIEWLSEIGGEMFAGVEGAPGHQNQASLGAYGGPLLPEDRWDPAIAPPGAIWDHLLAAGSLKSGALATSDFHGTDNGDYWPGQFSATWIYAPDRSIQGVLRALHAGSFVGVHGGIARRVQLLVSTDGVPRPAVPGERLHVPAGRKVSIELRAEVPSTDWQGQPNHVDLVELLGVTAAGTTVLRVGPARQRRLTPRTGRTERRDRHPRPRAASGRQRTGSALLHERRAGAVSLAGSRRDLQHDGLVLHGADDVEAAGLVVSHRAVQHRAVGERRGRAVREGRDRHGAVRAAGDPFECLAAPARRSSPRRTAYRSSRRERVTRRSGCRPGGTIRGR